MIIFSVKKDYIFVERMVTFLIKKWLYFWLKNGYIFGWLYFFSYIFGGYFIRVIIFPGHLIKY